MASPSLPKSGLPFYRAPTLSLLSVPPPPPHRIRSSPLLVFLLILAAAFWLLQLLRSACNLFSYWDIQVFYREALHIPPVSGAGGSVEGVPRQGGRKREERGADRQKPSLIPEALSNVRRRGITTYKAWSLF